MKFEAYGMTCHFVLPSSRVDLLRLNGQLYEVFAPGTCIVRNRRQNLLWRGLYLARRVKSG